MPHVKEEPVVILEHPDGTMVAMIKWRREGQCVCFDPAPCFRVLLRGGVTVDVQASSAHKGRSVAVDIAELFRT